MKRRYRYDRSQGRVVEVFAAERPGAHNLIHDCYANNPVLSPVDGSLLDSRAKLRAHNARNGCVDFGNDAAFCDPARQGRDWVPNRAEIRDDIRRSLAENGWGD